MAGTPKQDQTRREKTRRDDEIPHRPYCSRCDDHHRPGEHTV